MAVLKSIQSGNFTDSSTWAIVDQGTYLHQTATAIAVTGTIMEGSNFTVSSNITISGVMLHIAAAITSAPGNFVVRFHNVTTATDLKIVTINASDIPTNESGSSASRNVGWMFFKFDSPITLSTTQTYRLRISASNGTSTIAVMGTAGNTFDRALVTTTNAAPAATDILIINGENISAGVFNRFTVTMNNPSSATTYGQTFVDVYGTFRWADTPSSTFYYRMAGNLWIRGAGELIMGDNTTPIPSSTTCSLEISCSSPAQFIVTLGSTGRIVTRGANLGTYKTELNADVSAGASSFVTSVATDWVSGDRIVVAGTTRSANQTEVVTVSSVSGTTVNITGTFSFSHLGTGDIKADVGKLNRNVRIFGSSATNHVNSIDLQSNLSTLNFNNTECYDIGAGAATPMLTGINFSGLITLRNSSLYSTVNRSVTLLQYGNSRNRVDVVDNNIFYNTNVRAIDGSFLTININTPITVRNNLLISTGGFTGPINGDFNNNIVCGRTNSAAAVSIVNKFSGTLDNIKIYGMTSGIEFNTGISVDFLAVSNGNIINSARIFRNNGSAVSFNTTNNTSTQTPVILDGGRFFGNATSALQVTGFSNINVLFINCSFWGGTTEVTPTLISRNTSVYGQTMNRLFFDNCRFGTDYNGNVSNFSSAIIALNGSQNAFFSNCLFSGTEASTPGVPMERFVGYVSVNHNQVPGAMRAFKSSCITLKDTTIIDELPSSIRLVPQSTSFNSISDIYKVIAKSGQSITVSVRIRKSASPDTAYNGTQPQLIYLYNPAVGNNSNTVVATCVSANGNWETLSYTTPTLSQDTVLEFYILCNASAGFVNISNFRTNTFNNSKSNEYWGFDGLYIEPFYKTPGVKISSVF